MPHPEPPSSKAPAAQASADEPRSRKPARARNAATASASCATISINWSETAATALKNYAWQNAIEKSRSWNRTSGKFVYAASQGAKRAHNLVARQAIKLALQAATPLYPSLRSHIQTMTAPVEWHLDLQWLSDEETQILNRDTRGKNRPTDVLSFPIWEGETFPAPPDQSAVMLGDLVISVETAMAQARELNHDLRAEIAFLATHGTLHLLGYDHQTDSQRRKMFALQDEIVARVREAKGF